MTTTLPKQTSEFDPPFVYPPYASTVLRGPLQAPLSMPVGLTERTSPMFGSERIGPVDADLTLQHSSPPQGERIIVSGRVLDSSGRPVRRQLVEIWQTNAAGRYIHLGDQHGAPLDPNFSGSGRTLTDDDGRYRFVSIKPGAYPWQNHPNAWRPAHIHFSVFGTSFVERLITQMYFPGDPLLELDPVFGSIRDVTARNRLVSSFNLEETMPAWALAYRFDIVLGGAAQTPFEQ